MNRPLLTLWPIFLMCALLSCVGAVVSQWWFGSTPVGVVVVIAYFGWCLRGSRWLWQFVGRVRLFRTIDVGDAVVHYAPELHGRIDFDWVGRTLRDEQTRLTRWFGSPLRRRPTVYLFSDWHEIAAVAAGAGGAAIPRLNALMLPVYGYPLREIVAHESAHLFIHRMTRSAPPLLVEGLATWLQETEQGEPIDSAARLLVAEQGVGVETCLSFASFHSEPGRYERYIRSGSFVGFLLRRHGWPRLANLLRRCDGQRFRAKFERAYGMTQAEAERQWKAELLTRPVLSEWASLARPW